VFPIILDEVRRKAYYQKVLGIDRDNLIGYWPMWEASGGVAEDISPEGNDGAYTGVTLGQAGIGDGKTCPLFDGANDYNNIYSAALNTDFDGTEGTWALWTKVSGLGVWTDGKTNRGIHIGVNPSNETKIYNHTNNGLAWEYKAGGVTKTATKVGITDIGWMHWALTWSLTNDEVIPYFNGIQEGSIHTGIGTWVGDLASSTCIIGAESTVPASVWDGNIADVPLWNIALTAAQIAKLTVV